MIGSPLLHHHGAGSTVYLLGLGSSITADGAWSLRKLSAASTNAINVRRDFDNATQDIGFSGGNLNTSALTTFVTNSGANPTANGYIVTWYDQSTNASGTLNGHDLTEPLTAYQFRIVNQGTVEQKNSLPAARALGQRAGYTTNAFTTAFTGTAVTGYVVGVLPSATSDSSPQFLSLVPTTTTLNDYSASGLALVTRQDSEVIGKSGNLVDNFSTSLSTSNAPTPTTQQLSDLTTAYNGYLTGYVDRWGRVIRHDQGGDIVSEGLAYVMEMSALMKDKVTFDLVNNWGNSNLKRSLPASGATTQLNCWAWHANPSDAPTLGLASVIDWNHATDAEFDRVIALWRAIQIWGDSAYSTQLTALAADLKLNILIDGSNGYQTSDSFNTNPSGNHSDSTGVVAEVGPDYSRPLAYRILKQFTGDTVWDTALNGYYVMQAAVTSSAAGSLQTTHGLPPDWAYYDTFNHTWGALVSGTDGWGYSRDINYSYNAFRGSVVYMYLDWQMYNDTRAYTQLSGNLKTFFTSEWNAHGNVSAEYTHTGSVLGSRYEKNFFTGAARFALLCNDPSNTAAAAMKTSKLTNTLVNNGTYSYFASDPTSPTSSYFGDAWMWFYQAIDCGLYASIVTPTSSALSNVYWTGWSTSAPTVSIISNQVNIQGASTYPGLTSAVKYDLTGSSASVRVPQTLNRGTGTTETVLQARTDINNYMSILVSNGALNCRERASGVNSDFTVAYNATNHRWWRIRENAGTLFWETSPDGVTWTTLRSKTRAMTAPTSVNLLVQGGYYGTETSPGTAIFDNFNTTVGATANANWTSARAVNEPAEVSASGAGALDQVTSSWNAGTASISVNGNTPATGSGNTTAFNASKYGMGHNGLWPQSATDMYVSEGLILSHLSSSLEQNNVHSSQQNYWGTPAPTGSLTAVQQVAAGYTLVAQDTFDTNDLSTNWQLYDSGPMTNRSGGWFASQANITGGNLVLSEQRLTSPRSANVGGPYSYIGGAGYWRAPGAIARGGLWECRVKYAPGTGCGCAILLWPDGNFGNFWPEYGEIDILELTNDNKQGGNANFHLATTVNNGRHIDVPQDLSTHPITSDHTAGNLQIDWTVYHVLQLAWIPDQFIQVYVDGILKGYTTDLTYVPSGNAAVPMRLTFQQELNGDFASMSTTPTALSVDYVKYYSPS